MSGIDRIAGQRPMDTASDGLMGPLIGAVPHA